LTNGDRKAERQGDIKKGGNSDTKRQIGTDKNIKTDGYRETKDRDIRLGWQGL
jgi:hypothetical protein